MTTEDVLLNSYSSGGIEFNEYEKSIFLTKAQEDLLVELYNGKNPFRESFEETEEIRRYLSNLVKTYTTTEKIADITGISDKSVFFKLPSDLWFIVYESVELRDDKLGCKDGNQVLVVPTTLDDYYNTYNNPFRGPGYRRVLRLDIDNGIAEIVSKYNISRYLVRYLSKPNPIILVALPAHLNINGESKITECDLHPALHRVILDRAVGLAIASKGLDTNRTK